MKRLLALLCILASPVLAQQDKHSSFELMKPETQAMQRDDASNPAMLWVKDGTTLWNEKAGSSNQSCADCHGDVSTLRGVATRYPAFVASATKVVTLDQRINICRTERQKAEPFRLESKTILALSALLGLQSRGLPIAKTGPAEAQTVEAGRAAFMQRRGQMNLSCAQCHDDNAGRSLGGAIIPQGHPTGYPLYRLEWQDVGSLERRLRNCMIGVRSEPFAYGDPELVAIETYLRDRAAGLLLETPAVRP